MTPRFALIGQQTNTATHKLIKVLSNFTTVAFMIGEVAFSFYFISIMLLFIMRTMVNQADRQYTIATNQQQAKSGKQN